MLHWVRRISLWIDCKWIKEESLDVKSICLKQKDISAFPLSSNLILSFWHEGKLYYFRECPEICGYRTYFRKALDRFFEFIYQIDIPEEHFKQRIPITIQFEPDTVAAFHQYIYCLIEEPNCLKELTRFDLLSNQMGFSIWESSVYDEKIFSAFGLRNLPLLCYDIAILFIWYMRGVSAAYRTAHIVRGKQYSYFSAAKSIASKMIAKEMGLSELITTAELCRIELENGESLFGVLSDAAGGERMSDSFPQVSGSLQRELINLNVLDAVCYQLDHGPNNYNVSVNSDGEYRICAFDNDNPRTFFPIPSISGRLAGCASLVDKDGMLNRPYFDRYVAEKIQRMDMKTVITALKPYLNGLQLAALRQRVRKLRKVIVQTQQKRKTFLLEEKAWNEETAAEELSSISDLSYLGKALDNKKDR